MYLASCWPSFWLKAWWSKWESFRRLVLVVEDDRGYTRDITPRPLVGD